MGEITGQEEIRDLGAYLYTIESEAIEQYWFDIDNDVFPESFDHKTAGMITRQVLFTVLGLVQILK